jgi:hypothetical protein
MNVNNENYIQNLSNILSIKSHNNMITSIIKLNDGRLASSSFDDFIKIYEKFTFIEEIKIKEDFHILFINQFSNNIFVSCIMNNTLKFYKFENKNLINFQIYNSKNSIISKIKELKNNKLISVSDSYEIFIWDFNKNENYFIEFILKDEDEIWDFLEIKNNIIVVDICDQNIINFWDLNQKQKIKTIDSIEIFGNYGNKFSLLNENILLYGSDSIYVIDLINFNIINNFSTDFYSNSLLVLNNNIFSVHNNGNIYQWKFENNKLIIVNEIIKAHQNKILNIIQYNKNFLITSDSQGLIKLWNLNYEIN